MRAALATSLLTLLAGCGDNNSSADAAAFCDASLAFDQGLGRMEEPTPEALAELRPSLDNVAAAAPEELSDPLTTIVDAFDASTNGDFSQFESPHFATADIEVHTWTVDRCGWELVEVGMQDYEFTATMPTEPGVYSFDVSNDGDEAHLFAVAKLREGVEGTAEEVFATTTEETFDRSFERLGALFIEPDASDYQYLDLEPGRYVVYCPVPVGSTAEAHFEGDGPPHFVEGMVTSFNILA